jgi:hypothetical protein
MCFPIIGLQDQGNVYIIRTLHLSILFSAKLAIGIRTRIMRKYRMDAIWLMMIKGGSTGYLPIHVRVRRSAARAQNRHCLIGQNIRLHCLDVCGRGKITRIRMDRTRAMTLPSLLGIDRRIA